MALGSQVLASKDKARVSVQVNHQEGSDNTGSTLIIGLAEDKDAGQYVCQLGNTKTKEIKHTVIIRGILP